MRPNRFIIPGLLLAVIVFISAPLLGAGSTFKATVPAGDTVVTVGGEDFLITASEPVVVFVQVDEETVTGVAEPPQGSNTQPYVTIIRLGEPDETIFSGKVNGPTYFDSRHPHETGHVDL